MSYKVKIDLEFDTFKPTEDDIFQYINKLYSFQTKLDKILYNNKHNNIQ